MKISLTTMASDGTNVKPGEITTVFYFENQVVDGETVRVYATDGWIEGELCGRYRPSQLGQVAAKLFNKNLSEANDMFQDWLQGRKLLQSSSGDSKEIAANVNPEELIDIEVDGIDTSDYPDFCDAYISYAYNTRLDRPLVDIEIDFLNEKHSDFVYECVQEKLY